MPKQSHTTFIWITIQFDFFLYEHNYNMIVDIILLYNAESSVQDYSRIETELRNIPNRAGNMVMITNLKQYVSLYILLLK